MTQNRCHGSIGLYVVLLAAYFSAGAGPYTAGAAGEQVSFSIQRPVVTLGEPAYVLLFVNNLTSRGMTVYLGKRNTAGFRFTITEPNGNVVRAPIVGAGGGMGETGRTVVGAGKSYELPLLVNEWYNFREPGSYKIQVNLVESPTLEPGKIIKVWSSPEMRLTVLPRNPVRLREVCEKLTTRGLSEADLPAAAEAAVALSYIQDPVALPYLGRLLTAKNGMAPLAIQGLVRIGTPGALSVLDSHRATSNGSLRVLIQQGIQEIKAGVHPTATD
jgi:hypothetical protein